MFLNLLFSSLIATAPITPSPTPSAPIAKMQNQSSASNSLSAVEVAARNHRFWFKWYVIWIVFAAIVSAFLTWMLWKSGNRQQDSVIAETNERTATLENKTSLLKVTVAEAETKRAEAEKSLLELQRLIKEPRTIDSKRGDEILDWGEKGSVDIASVAIGDEPSNFANQLVAILDAHGWRILGNNSAVVAGGPRPGIVISAYGETKGTVVVSNWTDAPEPAKTLHRLLVEAVKGNPMVETRISPDSPKDKLGVM